MLAFVVTAIPSLTASECALSFISANPDLRKFELYDTWFDDNSTTTLAQAGVYKGADDIKEYIKFVWASPYISANGFLHDQYSLVSFDEEKRSCVFMSLVHSRFQMSEMGGNELFETVSFNTAEWRFDDRKVGRLEFFCALPPPGSSAGDGPTRASHGTQHVEYAAVTLWACADPASPAAAQMPRTSLTASSLPSRHLAPTASSAR